MERDAATHKRGHRRTMRERRAAVAMEEARIAAERLRDHLLLHPLVRSLGPGPVLVPVRHGAEIDTAPLSRLLATRGWTICRPRTHGEHLDAVPVAHDDALSPGYAGILEPRPDAVAVAPTDLTLVLVPGLAFDRAGHRIGYGGGHFDRFLARLGDAVTIGIGYRFQLIEDPLPRETHDVAVDGLQLEDLSLLATS